MQIDVNQPVQQTVIFSLVFLVLLALSFRRSKAPGLTPDASTELKGLAILMVLFGHIGYLLSKDQRFMFPWSVDAGVGVNIFFFLSGFGLAASSSKKPTTILGFYKKRFLSIFPALWLSLVFYLLLDHFLPDRNYPTEYLLNIFLGFYPSADPFKDINSPLWYVTPIVFYYLIFPLVNLRKFPLITAVLLAAIGRLLTGFNLPVHPDLQNFYKLHYLAFPMGVGFYGFISADILSKIKSFVTRYIKIILTTLAVFAAGYFSIYSNVGHGVYQEQLTSLLIVLLLAVTFSIKGVYSKLLVLFGTFSYEIYLLHWPLMFRYDFLYKNLPDSIATLLYLLILLLMGWGLKWAAAKLQKPFSK